MKRRACVIAAAAVLGAGVPTRAAGISERLDDIANQLSSAYQAKHPNAGKQTVAVFPFSSNDELAKQRVGFAVSELLTSKLAKLPEFTVVERSQLDQVLKEQKLQTTGAIDPESAVRVGKLLGAQLLVLGSVEKLGGSYQVNARIVDAATSEVAATTYKELPAGMFEQAAEPYLMLVPERQAIGLYLLYDYRHNSNTLSPISTQFYGTTAPHSFDLQMIGGGIRYEPVKGVMLDGSLAATTGSEETNSLGGAFSQGNGQIESGSIVARLTGNYVRPLYSRLTGIVGAGLSLFKLSLSHAGSYSAAAPVVRAGVEYRPQERLGLGLLANYDFVTKKQLGGAGTEFELSGFSIEPTVAVYF